MTNKETTTMNPTDEALQRIVNIAYTHGFECGPEAQGAQWRLEGSLPVQTCYPQLDRADMPSVDDAVRNWAIDLDLAELPPGLVAALDAYHASTGTGTGRSTR